MLDQETLFRSIKSHQTLVKKAIETNGFERYNVINADQSGFNYEIVSNRTLSIKGEMCTLAALSSPSNKMIHSHTVQYTINASGEIVGNVFICLQESGGRFGPLVEKAFFKPVNVVLTCSISGKLSSSHYRYYLENVLKKVVKGSFLLLIDSWNGQKDIQMHNEVFGVKNVDEEDDEPDESQSSMCKVCIIPPGTTSICQPCDVYFYRQVKLLTRKATHGLRVIMMSLFAIISFKHTHWSIIKW